METISQNSTYLSFLNKIHRHTDGFVAIFQKSANGSKYSQHHFKLQEITEDTLLKIIETNKNVYFSTQTFYRPIRKIEHLRQIHTCFVDIDFYKVDRHEPYSLAKILYILENDYYGKIIPRPNTIIYSGRGIQLLWLIEPLSGLAVSRWSQLQQELYKALIPLGADNKALDASRVLRLPGSIHRTANKRVTYDWLHDYEYDFYEICKQYFPHMPLLKQNWVASPEKQPRTTKKSVQHTDKKVYGAPKKFTGTSLNQARLNDLFKLVELRKGNCTGTREYFLFLCRYFALETSRQGKANKETLQKIHTAALNKAAQLNALFTEPLDERSWHIDTASAEGYHETRKLRLTNAKLIQWLEITEEEQKYMTTIIGKREKVCRKAQQAAKQRRASGCLSSAAYNKKRISAKLRMVKRLAILKKAKPNLPMQEYARILGISKTTVHRYLNTVISTFHHACSLIGERVLLLSTAREKKDVEQHISMNRMLREIDEGRIRANRREGQLYFVFGKIQAIKKPPTV